MKLSIEQVRELFDYEPSTGFLRRNYNRCGIVVATGIRVMGKWYAVADICWAHYYGKWPDKILDHIDRDRYNTEINNLREATTQQNGYNQVRFNPHGMKGITYDETRSKPWRAQIRIKGVKTNLGRFYTKDEAYAAYCKAAAEHHAEFALYD